MWEWVCASGFRQIDGGMFKNLVLISCSQQCESDSASDFRQIDGGMFKNLVLISCSLQCESDSASDFRKIDGGMFKNLVLISWQSECHTLSAEFQQTEGQFESGYWWVRGWLLTGLRLILMGLSVVTDRFECGY